MKKIVFRIIIFIELIAVLLSVVVPATQLYRNDTIRGYKYSYNYFDDDIVDYKTLFYDPPTLDYELYTLGFTSQEEAHILNGQTIFKRRRNFDEDSVVKFNNILKQCHFKPVDKKKAAVLSIFVSDFTNVAYTDIRDDYISPEMLEATVENDSFKPDVLKYVMDKGFGVSSASINKIFGKTYMFALFYSGQETVTLKNGEKYIVPKYSEQKISVFEVVSDDAGKELISNRRNFWFYSTTKFSYALINFYNPINWKVTLILFGLLLITVIVYCIITIRRKKIKKSEIKKAEIKKNKRRKSKKKK